MMCNFLRSSGTSQEVSRGDEEFGCLRPRVRYKNWNEAIRLFLPSSRVRRRLYADLSPGSAAVSLTSDMLNTPLATFNKW